MLSRRHCPTPYNNLHVHIHLISPLLDTPRTALIDTSVLPVSMQVNTNFMCTRIRMFQTNMGHKLFRWLTPALQPPSLCPVPRDERSNVRLQSGHTLRALISQRGLNQSRLAAAADCSPSFVNALCAGTKTSCSDGLAARIAQALEVPTHILFMPTESRDTGQTITRQATAVVA